MTPHELIDETVEFYGADPSRLLAVNKEGLCVYCTDDGRMCAVGRCLVDPEGMEREWSGTSVAGLYWQDELLKPRYHGFDKELWSELQSLHDDRYNWECDGVGLSEQGEATVTELKERWA